MNRKSLNVVKIISLHLFCLERIVGTLKGKQKIPFHISVEYKTVIKHGPSCPNLKHKLTSL